MDTWRNRNGVVCIIREKKIYKIYYILIFGSVKLFLKGQNELVCITLKIIMF